MLRRALLLLAMTGIYLAVRRSRQTEAQWANEGGANAHASV